MIKKKRSIFEFKAEEDFSLGRFFDFGEFCFIFKDVLDKAKKHDVTLTEMRLFEIKINA